MDEAQVPWTIIKSIETAESIQYNGISMRLPMNANNKCSVDFQYHISILVEYFHPVYNKTNELHVEYGKQKCFISLVN